MKKDNVFYVVSTVVSISLLFLIVYLNNVNVRLSIQKKRLREEIALLKSCHNNSTQFDIKHTPQRQYFYTKVMNISAYCPCELCCGKYADGVTATGKNAYTKGVAVDPNVIPLGTKIYIPGYGTVVADDVGGAIKGDKLDVRFPTHREALEWGRKHKEVTVFLK